MVVRQYHPWVGGTERQAHKLATTLRQLGQPVTVVTGWWFRGTAQQEVIDTVPVFRNFTFWEMFGLKGLRKFGGYTYILTLFWHLWRHRHEYDLLHIHQLNYHAFPAVLAGRWLGKKTLIKIANSGAGSDLLLMRDGLVPGQRFMLPTTLTADRFVAINAEIVGELQRAGVPPEKIVFIPNGVAVDPDGARDYALRPEPTILFVGRLHPNKGLDVLLAAFQSVVQRCPARGWRLWLVGDGPLRQELEAQARQLGVAERVKFWGQIEDVTAFWEQADCFALPSRAEGMSNALLEAMAHGLPCVTSRISANAGVLQDGENGLVVEARPDGQALAAALERLADDEGLRRRLGQAARRTAAEKYSLQSVAGRYLELYQTLQA